MNLSVKNYFNTPLAYLKNQLNPLIREPAAVIKTKT
jgi:hypothetical protein